MWAFRRRVEIIGIVVAAIIVFVVFPYWATHRVVPTCTDSKQNQGEQGVDCGGPCALLCKGQAQELNVLWTKVFTIRPGVYDIAAYVENPNADVAAPSFFYTAKLYDAGGTVIAQQAGDSFALPNERFALFAGGLHTGEKEATQGSIEITPGFAWVTVAPPKDPFSVSDKSLISPDHLPKLSAVLHNDSADLYRNIDVETIIYDSKSQPIGVSSTQVEKLGPGEAQSIFFTWPMPFNYVADTEQCATPVDIILALDRSGSMNSDGQTPPEPLTQAKAAAEQFVQRLTDKDQAGYVSFATAAANPIDQPLTNNVDRISRAIDKTAIGSDGIQYTNIGDALRRAIDEFGTLRRNSDARAVIVLLTDGIPTYPKDPANPDYPSQYALAVADEAKKDDITLYTIGLGQDVNAKLLQLVASAPEYYYAAASGAELGGIYQQISTAICKKGPSIIEIIPRVNNALPASSTH